MKIGSLITITALLMKILGLKLCCKTDLRDQDIQDLNK